MPTKRDIETMFFEDISPLITKRYGVRDKVAARTAWNDYIDTLQKDGTITESQASNWLPPRSLR